MIKEIDTSSMTTEQAYEAIEEIKLQAEVDSPYIVFLSNIITVNFRYHTLTHSSREIQ